MVPKHLLVVLLLSTVSAFAPSHSNNRSHLTTTSCSLNAMTPNRRDVLKLLTLSIPAAVMSSTPPATAAESTIWKTGRAPEIPGQKPRDKSDTKGTRKDPNFLRSIADCKGKCENSPGPDGLARSSVECLSACQDICCTTYEQCTFAIVAR
eukprot:scaffold81936_cov56-Cyclotella_meneghiniana.AAC.8